MILSCCFYKKSTKILHLFIFYWLTSVHTGVYDNILTDDNGVMLLS